MAITLIKHKGLRELFETGKTKKIGTSYHKKLLDLLDMLNAAFHIKDLRGVSDFHALKGNRKGEFCMHVNGPKIITFGFDDGEVTNVNFENDLKQRKRKR
ncbi:MAG: type II toxin-antitoxin system RelE/ParE family toxin [Proteobacteria bacterium]|nr:type II toxin-antitoxin system RelE/ParE family toxin [Pseudomonadota bacterium]